MSQTCGGDGPHRLDNDIDPTMTLSNDRGKEDHVECSVKRRRSLPWKEVEFDIKVNLSQTEAD